MLLIIKVSIVLVWIFFLLPVQALLILIRSKLRFYLPIYFHKFLLRVLGIRLTIKGKVSSKKPLILVGNHSSYLDIIVLGSIIPVCFVAKSEIKSWFLFGLLARLQNTIFIERKSMKIFESITKVSKSLSGQFALIIFPEGTTNNGKKVLKFRPSLFKIFEDNPTLGLQNFSLCYTHINSMPLDNRLRPTIAWYGGMDMVNHLSTFMKLSSVNVSLIFHPISVSNGLNRKTLSENSRKQVVEGLSCLSNISL